MATQTCTHCGARGVIEGVAPEVVPQKIKCGHCLKLFDFHATAWDHVTADYDGEVAPFFMRVTERPSQPVIREVTEEEVEQQREERRTAALKAEHTRVLYGDYNSARAAETRRQLGPSPGLNEPPRIQIGVFWFSMAEVKAELATREHIPNKQEAKAIRQAKAQGKRAR